MENLSRKNISFLLSRYPQIILVLFFFIFYFPLLSGMDYMWEDILKQHYPNIIYTMNALLQGDFPHWTPHVFAGMPYMADLQTAIFYPPHWLLFLLHTFTQSGGIIFIWFALCHILLFGFGIYKLCLAFNLDPIVSAYAAVSAMFCGFISLHVHHLNALYVISWFPWVFLFLKKSLEKKGMKYPGIASLFLGISILGGYTQYTLFCCMILFGYTLFSSLANTKIGFKKASIPILKLILIVVLAFGLALIQLLPTTELYQESTRTRMSWEESAQGSVSFANLITFLAPKFFGQVNAIKGTTYWGSTSTFAFWETAIFIGILPLILLSLGLPYLSRKRDFLFFFIVGIFGLIMAMGKNLPFYSLVFQLPVFNRFRIPGRFSFIFSFGFIMASAISLNYLQKNGSVKKKFPRKAFLTGLILSLAMVSALIIVPSIIDIPGNRKTDAQSSIYLALLSIFLSWILMISLARSKQKKKPLLAIVVFTFAELFLFSFRFGSGLLTAKQAYPPRGIFVKLKTESEKEFFRIKYHSGNQENKNLFSENLGNVYQIPTINGYNQLQLSRFIRFINQVENGKASQLLNVKYHLRADGINLQKFSFKNPCPHFNLISDIAVAKNGQEVIQKINDANFNPRFQAVVEVPLNLAIRKNVANQPAGTVSIKAYRYHKIALDIQATQNALLFSSEIWYPGWHATLDGKEVPIWRTNYLFRGVEIPRGNHRVTFYYSSTAFFWGKWFSLMFLAIILFSIVHVPGRMHSQSNKSD